MPERKRFFFIDVFPKSLLFFRLVWADSGCWRYHCKIYWHCCCCLYWYWGEHWGLISYCSRHDNSFPHFGHSLLFATNLISIEGPIPALPWSLQSANTIKGVVEIEHSMPCGLLPLLQGFQELPFHSLWIIANLSNLAVVVDLSIIIKAHHVNDGVQEHLVDKEQEQE